MNAANKAFERQDYSSSEYYYKFLFDRVEQYDRFRKKLDKDRWDGFDPVDLQFRHAYSLWELNEYDGALRALRKVLADPAALPRYHVAHFFIADALHHQRYVGDSLSAVEASIDDYQLFLDRSRYPAGTVFHLQHAFEYYDSLSAHAERDLDWALEIRDQALGEIDTQYIEVVKTYVANDSLDTEDNRAIRDTFFAQSRRIFANECFEFFHLDSFINSPYGDFGAVLLNPNTLLFTTFEESIRRRVGHPDRTRFNEVYNVLREKLQAPEAGPFQLEKRMAPVADPDSINHRDFLPLDLRTYHTGMVALSPDKDSLYYAQCEYVGKTFRIRCDIYRKNWLPLDSTWSKGVPLKDINLDSVSTEMPSWGKVDGRASLIFASDREDETGLGLRDIYYAHPDSNGGFGPVQKLQVASTIGDDVSPFYHWKTGRLFFSTDGLKTLGGLDVHMTHQSDGVWQEPVNLEYPVNSTYNDFSYYQNESGHVGLLASDRLGSRLVDNQIAPCCPDLWQVNYSLDLKATIRIFNEKPDPDTLLAGSSLRIFEEGLDQPLFEGEVEPGTLQLRLDYGKNYTFYASKVGFEPDSGSIKLEGFFPLAKDCVSDTLLDLHLRPEEFRIRVEVVDARLDDFILDFVDLDYQQQDSISQRQVVLAPVATASQQRDSGFYLFELPDPGFTADGKFTTTVDLNASDPNDFFFPGQSVDRLHRSQFRDVAGDPYMHEALIRLPLCPDTTVTSLYFNHDRPIRVGGDIRVDTVPYGLSIDRYDLTFERYLAELEGPGIQERLAAQLAGDRNIPPTTLRNLPPDKRELFRDSVFAELKDAEKMISFFGGRVKENFEKLNQRLNVISAYLNRGEKVVIQLSGFTSPTGGSGYNHFLSKRRINSVRQYMESILKDQLRANLGDLVNQGALQWDTIPRGEGNVRIDMQGYLEENAPSFAQDEDFIDALVGIADSTGNVLRRRGVLPALGRRIEMNFFVVDEAGNKRVCPFDLPARQNRVSRRMRSPAQTQPKPQQRETPGTRGGPHYTRTGKLRFSPLEQLAGQVRVTLPWNLARAHREEESLLIPSDK